MIGNTFFFEWEVRYMVFLQKVLGTFGAKAAVIFTYLSEPAVVLGLFFILYYGIDKKLGKKLALMIIGATVSNCLIKNLVLRRRPYFDHEQIACLKKVSDGELYDIHAQGYSFPSAHSMNAGVIYGTLAQQTRKNVLKAVCYLLIILVGISRNVLGVHYPTDVLTGWLLAFVVMFGLEHAQTKLGKKKTYLVVTVIGLLGLFYCSTSDYFSSLGGMLGYMAGDLFEEKYVNFESTRDIKVILARMIGAGLLVGALYGILKPVMPSINPAESGRLIYLWKTFRNAVLLFTAVGFYPWLFQKVEKK